MAMLALVGDKDHVHTCGPLLAKYELSADTATMHKLEHASHRCSAVTVICYSNINNHTSLFD